MELMKWWEENLVREHGWLPPSDVANLRAEIERLRAALERIAAGHAAIDGKDIAKAALTSH
jgi:hypothetical protein